jgi:hypothetical protein
MANEVSLSFVASVLEEKRKADRAERGPEKSVGWQLGRLLLDAARDGTFAVFFAGASSGLTD